MPWTKDKCNTVTSLKWKEQTGLFNSSTHQMPHSNEDGNSSDMEAEASSPHVSPIYAPKIDGEAGFHVIEVVSSVLGALSGLATGCSRRLRLRRWGRHSNALLLLRKGHYCRRWGCRRRRHSRVRVFRWSPREPHQESQYMLTYRKSKIKVEKISISLYFTLQRTHLNWLKPTK
jgi:hypothetical protein